MPAICAESPDGYLARRSTDGAPRKRSSLEPQTRRSCVEARGTVGARTSARLLAGEGNSAGYAPRLPMNYAAPIDHPADRGEVGSMASAAPEAEGTETRRRLRV